MRMRGLACAVAVAALAACSGDKVVQPTVNVSIGQQLIDLKKAHDSGALKDNEYQKQRKMLIDNVR
jgi:hypothetical protein